MNLKYLLQVILISVSICSYAGEGGGHDVGNGGDRDEILWRSIASELESLIKDESIAKKFPEINYDEFAQITDEVKISVVDTELRDHDGKIRTAINQPEKKLILVNRALFTPIRADAKIVVPLVFHELLGLVGAEKSGEYTISQRVSTWSEVVYKSAVAHLSDIYFLTGSALTTPIPLWKSSVTSHNGSFTSGIVARPFTLITDKVKVIVPEGIGIYWERFYVDDADGANSTMVYGFTFSFPSDRSVSWEQSYYRQSAQEPWQAVSLDRFTLNSDTFAIAFIELDQQSPNGLYTPEVVGTLAKAMFSKNGNLEGAWCQKEMLCSYSFAGKNLNIRQIVHMQGDDSIKAYLSQDYILPVYKRQLPMKIHSDGYAYFNLTGEIIEGRIEGYTNFANQKYDLPYIRVKENGVVSLSRYKSFNPLVAGASILATDGAAEILCRKEGFDPKSSFAHARTLYFSGEKTFYDLDKDDFVTIANTARVITEVSCSDEISVDVNQVYQ